MIIAQSISAAKRSRQSIRSSVKPLAGPGSDAQQAVRPASRTACMPSHTAGLE